MKHIRVYFDFNCPYCYQEWANLRHLQHSGLLELAIEWYGWEIHPELQGPTATPMSWSPAHREMFGKLGQVTETNATSRALNASTHDALRLLEAAQEQHFADAWVDRVFRGYYEENANPADRATLLAWAEEIGLPNAAEVLDGDLYEDVLLAHDRHCQDIALEYVPSLEEHGKIIASGVLTYEHTQEVLSE